MDRRGDKALRRARTRRGPRSRGNRERQRPRGHQARTAEPREIHRQLHHDDRKPREVRRQGHRLQLHARLRLAAHRPSARNPRGRLELALLRRGRASRHDAAPDSRKHRARLARLHAPRLGARAPQRARKGAQALRERQARRPPRKLQILPRAHHPDLREVRRPHGRASRRPRVAHLRPSAHSALAGRLRQNRRYGRQPGQRALPLHRLARLEPRERHPRRDTPLRRDEPHRLPAHPQRKIPRLPQIPRSLAPFERRLARHVRDSQGRLRDRARHLHPPRPRTHDMGRAGPPRLRPLRQGARHSLPQRPLGSDRQGDQGEGREVPKRPGSRRESSRTTAATASPRTG